MWICLECGEVFDHNAARIVKGDNAEHFGHLCSLPDYMTCPACKSEDIEPARRCRMCGVYHSTLHYAGASALGDADLQVCEDCRTKVIKEFDRWKIHLTQQQQDVLRDAYAENQAF